MRITGRERAASRAVQVGRNVERSRELARLVGRPARPGLRTEQDAGPLRLHQQVGQALDVVRVGQPFRRRPVMPRLRDARLRQIDLGVEHVTRNLEEGRPRRAVEALAKRHRHHVGHPLGGRDGRGDLRDGREDVDVRQILQRAHLVLRQRALSADQQHRALGPERVGDAGDGVRRARPGRHDGTARLPGLSCISVRRVRRDLLVTDVDDLDALVETPVVDVDDVAAAQGEDDLDPFGLQRLGHEMAARDLFRLRPGVGRLRLRFTSWHGVLRV